MIKFLKNNLYIILLFAISLIVFVPTFNIKFSWIDDGWDILVADKIVETNIGRFRPVYWLWQTVVYIIGESYSSIHYLLHYVLIFSVVFLVYKIIYFFTKSNMSSFVGALILLIFPLNAENWIRLGPAEPIMIFFVLISFYIFFTKGDIKKSVFFIVLALLTKETVIAILPAFILYYFLLLFTKKKVKNTFSYVMGILMLCSVSVLISMLNKKGYSNSYVFNILTAKYNFELYLRFIIQAFPAIILFIGTLLIRNIRPIVNFKFNKIKEFEISKFLFLMLALSFILIQSPWAWVLNRYLLPAVAMGSIFIGLEFYSLNKKLRILVLIIISLFAINAIVKINEQTVRQRHSTNNIYLMIKRVSEVTPKDGKVYFNFKDNDGTMEPLFESDLHLKLFFNRQDIKVDFIENLDSRESNYIVLSGTPLGSFKYTDDKDLVNDEKLKNFETFNNESKFIVFSNYETIMKQISKKIFRSVYRREKIDSSGIYTNYLLKDSWSLYYY